MKRNKFSLSYYHLFSCRMGQLIPIGLTEVLPGDTIQHSTSLLLRASPLLAPVMHPVHIRVHHWFVPHRLVWDHWEQFITGGEDGMDASVFPTMGIAAGANVAGSLFDYYGIAPNAGNSNTVSALPVRGYNLIFNEFYRDQDLQTKLVLSKLDGNDTSSNRVMQLAAWEKDYFTSCRPFTEKGPQVTVPIHGTAPVTGIGKADGAYGTANKTVWESTGTQRTYAASDPINNVQWFGEKNPSAAVPNIKADMGAAGAAVFADINDLRLAFALQRYEEARARYGSRYTEYLRYLGVRSSDARLQRPEYLGGGKQTIQFSEVLQTAPVAGGDGTVGVGNLKGHGISALRSNRYRRFFEEHGYIHTFLTIRPRTMYTQSMARTWNRRVKEDFWQKELEHIGQQEVLNGELYSLGTANEKAGVFGYQDRYDEYRRTESRVSGGFRLPELDYWHMARSFTANPVLNASFVQSNPTERIFASKVQDTLWVMGNHSIQARRQLAKHGSSFIF